jgi:hypothetical protein
MPTRRPRRHQEIKSISLLFTDETSHTEMHTARFFPGSRLRRKGFNGRPDRIFIDGGQVVFLFVGIGNGAGTRSQQEQTRSESG